MVAIVLANDRACGYWGKRGSIRLLTDDADEVFSKGLKNLDEVSLRIGRGRGFSFREQPINAY
jgi:hypothetical protein